MYLYLFVLRVFDVRVRVSQPKKYRNTGQNENGYKWYSFSAHGLLWEYEQSNDNDGDNTEVLSQECFCVCIKVKKKVAVMEFLFICRWKFNDGPSLKIHIFLFSTFLLRKILIKFLPFILFCTLKRTFSFCFRCISLQRGHSLLYNIYCCRRRRRKKCERKIFLILLKYARDKTVT